MRCPRRQLAPPADDWLTFRIYGAHELQDAVLFEVVAPLVRSARAAKQLDGWFFLRYVDAASGRAHLRVRLRGRTVARLAALRRRFEQTLVRARQHGLIVSTDSAEYFRETARYGGAAALAAAEVIFAGSSDLVLAILALEHEGSLDPDSDRCALLVRAQDALARGLGLDLTARSALAARRRAAFAFSRGGEAESWPSEYRQRQRALAGWLGAAATPARKGAEADLAAPLFDRLFRTTIAAAAALAQADRAALVAALPALLHMQAVRLCGTEADDEQAAYVFWARALEGLAARARRS